ncbi:SDR family NAD(P)-dependent oxidoreductase [Phenylobacterium soli]|uniref:Short-chain dehydrogenase n=1 Tax=Phenylobacterium soli TaxID=2170551 RepID=A0A328AJ42_9CAUL|nr:SDR family NAD(P)-dependent oxidoreductase [Phenylobacterium soli]RAK54800.1 short-chain dehydrogenase [Phenylobacterium soli]
MSLESKRVLITGGSGELGSRIALLLDAEGAKVTVMDRQPPRNLPVDFLRCDLASAEGLEEAALQLDDRPVDILVNLAGVQHFGPVESQTPAHLQTTYMVNLVAPVRLTQAVLPGMRARGSGQIVNVGSIFGSINFAHFATYSSSKAGLRGFSQALRREVAGSGIDVTYIAPRAVKTGFNSPKVLEFAARTKMAMDDPDKIAGRIVESIAGRRGDVYLGFPEAVFVRLNALAPGLVDRALAAGDREVAKLFA